MHGDFSRWFGTIPKNQVGILAQEGRILLDADVNAHTLLGARWQDLAARAAFGARVAAIPADNIDAWKVIGAAIDQRDVILSILPGIGWADGLLVELEGFPSKPVNRRATWLGPPLQNPPQDLGAAGTRDAVILEVWRRSLNGYQSTLDLIEPALGGPDTAERVETAYALRLYRMTADQNCRTLDLNDKLATHGHLTVTIAPTTMTSGDCPVVQGGGYTGLEHDLYRVEITEVATGAASFKWSQWNGGLVGRGAYDATTKKLTLRSGDQAILRSGLTAFYLEALVFDTAAGHWRIAYGVPATLDLTTGEIDLSQAAAYGAPPDPGMVTNPSDPTDPTWFVRIWNGMRTVAEFPPAAATELRDGIRLELSGTTFVAGDYWTFPVRAGMDNPPTLLADAPPFGVHHHRVPLAELHWNGTGATIEDCRVPLHPITATDGCCTHSVGDGVTSHGDFASIQAAVDALPGTGGRVCVLPGTYTENVKVLNRRNIEIVGCGPRSRVIAKNSTEEFGSAEPAIYVLDTSGIKIEKLRVEAGQGGIAILLEEDAAAGTVGIEWNQPTIPFLEDIRIADCSVVAGSRSGIEIRGGHRSELVHNHVSCANQLSDWSLITVRTSDARIERNVVTVPTDKPGEYLALGGIWLRGGSQNIDVVDNEIAGGAGHGIMLGHAEQSTFLSSSTTDIHALSIRRGLHFGFVFNSILAADCVNCGPGIVVFPLPPRAQPPWVAGDPLADLCIRNNDISEMGISGVGVMGFFMNPKHGVIAIDRLEISENRIYNNVARGTVIDGGASPAAGYGAISLADVSELTITDNEIHDNGTRVFGQVCGIYVQHGSGVLVSRNRIYNNGPAPANTVATLPHGGVWLLSLMPPLEAQAGGRSRLSAAVRDNEIHSNNGPGLAMAGVGHYSIVANSITTRSSHGVTSKTNAVNVLIENTSSASGIRFPTFTGLRDRALDLPMATMAFRVGNRNVSIDDITDAELAGSHLVVKPGFVIGAVAIYMPGSVMFANNHVLTYSPDARELSAVAIHSLADVTVSGNHFVTEAPATVVMLPVVVIGSDTHVHNNRFIDRSTFASVGTWGYTNITTHNTADHCVLVTGQVAPISSPNIVRSPGILCTKFTNVLGNLGIGLAGIHP